MNIVTTNNDNIFLSFPSFLFFSEGVVLESGNLTSISCVGKNKIHCEKKMKMPIKGVADTLAEIFCSNQWRDKWLSSHTPISMKGTFIQLSTVTSRQPDQNNNQKYMAQFKNEIIVN